MSNPKSGQVLLITIMLLATVLTVVISLAYKTTTETQIAKLEEENQKALAAAETSVETLIEKNNQSGDQSYTLQSSGGQFQNITAQAQLVSGGTEYASPSVQKDQQASFYLSDYSSGSFSNPYVGTITVYYGSDSVSCNSLALELTVLAGSSPTITRYVADNNSLISHPSPDAYNMSVTTTPLTVDNVSFNCRVTLPAFVLSQNARILVARVLSTSSLSTKIGLSGTNPLKIQAKKIVSQATTSTGVTKRIQLKQTLPQIPSDFFVVSF